MSDLAQYTPEEQRRIREAFAAGGAMPQCPRCGVAMNERKIGGGSFGLGYARRREWLICPSCHRSAIFDVKRGTRN
jgi:ribosomal protein L37AE/L43A